MDDAVAALRQVAQDIARLKQEDAAPAAVAAACEAAMMRLLKLRAAYRDAVLQTERVREGTHALKGNLDATSLQLHNLLYEKHHFQRETAANLAYMSTVSDEAVGLAPAEQLLASLPADEAAALRADEHQLMLARLQHELAERRRLTSACNEVQEARQAEEDKLTVLRDRLEGIHSQLKAVAAAAVPVADAIGAAPPSIQGGSQLAPLLPLPLYVIYSMCLAAAQAEQVPLQVSISGDAAAAAAAEQAEAAATVTGGAKRARHLYETHPLQVDVSLLPQGGSSAGPLQLHFSFFPACRLVGAWSPAAQDDALLATPDDDGSGKGHAGLEAIAKGPYQFGDLTHGRPYRWAQELAGMQWVASLPSLAASQLPHGAERQALADKLSEHRRQPHLPALVERLQQAKAAQERQAAGGRSRHASRSAEP